MRELNATDFKGMLESACANLENHENDINTLNVFPVPDGDTGTNMYMTFKSGLKEAQDVLTNNIGDVAKALSKGLLMGARGNSGVITSQIFRGFSKYVKDKEKMSAKDLGSAFVEGAKVAYKAIIKPVEGTILTVIREGAWYANHEIENNEDVNIEDYFSLLLKYTKESLDKTPNLLSALKEASVVDSGGKGLYTIFEGFDLYLKGQPVIRKDKIKGFTIEDIKDEYHGYICKFKLKLNTEYRNFDNDIISNRLKSVGDDLSIKFTKEEIEVNINTQRPGDALNVAQRYGEFISIDINNSKQTKQSNKTIKKYGIIAVCSGEGIEGLFKELGVDFIISGGQTMNPCTKEFIDGIEELDNCETIFILPNNSNIIMAATQAKEMSNKKVIVIPSTSIQAGLSALAIFNSQGSKEDNERNMLNIVNNIKTASITYAIKDTLFEGVEVKEGDHISLVGKTIIASSNSLEEVCIKTVTKLLENEDKELMSIITGEGSDKKITDELVKLVEDDGKFEVQVIDGGQKVYSYLIGLE